MNHSANVNYVLTLLCVSRGSSTLTLSNWERNDSVLEVIMFTSFTQKICLFERHVRDRHNTSHSTDGWLVLLAVDILDCTDCLAQCLPLSIHLSAEHCPDTANVDWQMPNHQSFLNSHLCWHTLFHLICSSVAFLSTVPHQCTLILEIIMQRSYAYLLMWQ